jgi:TolA-binding protein
MASIEEQLKQLEQEIAAANERIRQLSEAKRKVQEEERQRVKSDLISKYTKQLGGILDSMWEDLKAVGCSGFTVTRGDDGVTSYSLVEKRSRPATPSAAEKAGTSRRNKLYGGMSLNDAFTQVATPEQLAQYERIDPKDGNARYQYKLKVVTAVLGEGVPAA